MKKICLSLSLIFIALIVNAEIDDTISIRGRVKHLLVQNYLDKVPSTINKDKAYREYYFSPDGKIIESYSYAGPGGDTKKVYVYDDNLNLVRITHFQKNKENLMDSVAVHTYKYDDQNRMIEMVRQQSEIAKGESFSYSYEYETEKNTTKKIAHRYKKDLVYDATSVSIINNDGLEIEYHNYKDKGLKVELITYDKYTYNNKKLKTKLELVPTKKTKYWETYKYNEQGDLIEKCLHNQKGENIYKYNYTYDKNNSWIVQDRGFGPTNRAVGIVRFIEYYN